MASIRIIAVPPGFAPEHIRNEWVGIEIPLATEEDLQSNRPSDLRLGNSNKAGYEVLAAKAVDALMAAGKEEAAEFWMRFDGNYLVFKREVCELIA